VVVVDELPRTGTRKLRRDQLTSLFDQRQDAAATGPDPSASSTRG
jgi:hypothetical protein